MTNKDEGKRFMPTVIHVHHDTEAHARSFNEGYEAAVTKGLADDPALADDWFQEKIREAKADAWDEGRTAAESDRVEILRNPYRSQDARASESPAG